MNRPVAYEIDSRLGSEYRIGAPVNYRKIVKDHVDDLHRNRHDNPDLQQAWNDQGVDSQHVNQFFNDLQLKLTVKEQPYRTVLLSVIPIILFIAFHFV